MQLRVAPDDIAASGALLRDDGPSLRGLAALLTSSRSELQAAGGTGRLARAADTFLAGSAAGLHVLAETVDLLAGGLVRASDSYRTTDDAAARTVASVGE